jgi:serine/threonine-protein kinase HipA
MKRLIVNLNGEKVGTLEQDDSGLLVFRYDPTWLAKPDAYPLSKALPLQTDPFHDKEARPFFAGVLPEEEPRRKIAAILGISANNDFAMLERIGGECAGAVSLLPEDAPPQPSGKIQLRRLTEKELKDVIDELPRRPLMAGKANLRLSLAGAQDKLPIVVDQDGIALPIGNQPSSHIIKPEPKRFPGLTANETFCMKLARAVELNVAEVQTRQVGDTPCILVTRYDRTIDSEGKLVRIHQEDFCQALGFPPERKYQQEGGPLVRDCIALLREWSSVPVVDIRQFVDGLIFNFLIGNADAHGKNFSMIYPPGNRRLAPFYDLVCTLAWPELAKGTAMKIGKCKSMNEITPDLFRRMVVETNLGWPMVRERIVNLIQNIRRALENQDFMSQFTPHPMVGTVSQIVSNRTSVMLKRMEAK